MNLFSPLGTEVDVGEYFIVTDRKKSKEHVIHFSKSIRGRPAIMGKSFNYLFFKTQLNLNSCS